MAKYTWYDSLPDRLRAAASSGSAAGGGIKGDVSDSSVFPLKSGDMVTDSAEGALIVATDDIATNQDLNPSNAIILAGLTQLAAMFSPAAGTMVFKGAYSSAVAYNVGEVVTDSGKTYICITSTTAGTLPSSGSFLQIA